MRQKKSLSCSTILQNAPAAIFRRSRELSRLDHAVRDLLPDNLATHCQVMNFRDGMLVLGTASAARATQLRFATPELEATLRRRLLPGIQSIRIRVVPETLEPEPHPRRPQTLSAASASLLAQTAQTLDHAGLKEALYRIATRTGEN